MRVTFGIIAALCLAAALRRTLAADSAPLQSSVASPVWSVGRAPREEPGGSHSNGPRWAAWDGGVILSGVGRRGDPAALKFAEKQAAGWSHPATVSSGANGRDSPADPPIVLRRPDGTLV